MTDTDSSPVLECPAGESHCEYLSELVQLRRHVGSLEAQVRTDALTGLHNYRHFIESLILEMERTRRTTQPLSLALLDIDHFKQLNDTWGHDRGNRILQEVAGRLLQGLRKLDIACRFGGEEFALILPNTSLQSAVMVAERVRRAVATEPFVCNADGEVTLTVSLGVDTFFANQGDAPEGFLRRVDEWMYRAKGAGRNCIAHPALKTTDSSTAITPDERDALYRP